jgi:N-acetylglucosamine kinase-like BadF-type ATPase
MAKSGPIQSVREPGLGCVFGVDGGASKTLCLVGSVDGRVLGLGRGGPSNHQVCGPEEAAAQIARSVREALGAGGVSAREARVGMFCLAGADLPEDYALLSRALEDLALCHKIVVKNDTMAALRSGLSRPWGVVVICGTGTNAAGCAPDGREIILPGLGYISGDWGGGAQISQEIIRHVMRAWDGRGKQTVLLEMALDFLGAASPESLLRMLYHGQIEQRQLLGLAPLLFEAACAGDEVACQLVREVGTEVGVTARTLVRRLSLQDEDVEVVLGGSIFKARGPLLFDTIRQVIHEVAPRASIVLPEFEPVVGAFFLALEAEGVEVKGTVKENVRATLPRELVIEGRQTLDTG